jgi:hypothetical protein
MQSAERPTEAIVYWRKAGEQAARHANNREAVAHFHRALARLEAQPQTSERWRTELAILSRLGPALMSVHGWAAGEAGEVVERATEIGSRLESSLDLAPSIANLWLQSSQNPASSAIICGRLQETQRDHGGGPPEVAATHMFCQLRVGIS